MIRVNHEKQESLISVVVPVFNSEDYIIEALESVFDQTYRPLELVIVDDGSTDRTKDVINDYFKEVQNIDICRSGQDKSDLLLDTAVDVKYIYQQNSGPSGARNAGIKAAGGEYIAFLDADDLWTPDKLSKQVSLFKWDDSLDIVFCNVRVTRVKEGLRKTFNMFEQQGLDEEFFGDSHLVQDPLAKLLKNNFMLTPSVVAKKSCFGKGFLFNERMRHAEDWELWLRLALHFRFGYIKDVCVHVRDEGDGLCAESDDMLLSALNAWEVFVRENLPHISRSISARELSLQQKKHYKWAGHYFMRKGNNRSARDFYRKSLKMGFDLKTAYFYLKTCLSG